MLTPDVADLCRARVVDPGFDRHGLTQDDDRDNVQAPRRGRRRAVAARGAALRHEHTNGSLVTFPGGFRCSTSPESQRPRSASAQATPGRTTTSPLPSCRPPAAGPGRQHDGQPCLICTALGVGAKPTSATWIALPKGTPGTALGSHRPPRVAGIPHPQGKPKNHRRPGRGGEAALRTRSAAVYGLSAAEVAVHPRASPGDRPGPHPSRRNRRLQVQQLPGGCYRGV